MAFVVQNLLKTIFRIEMGMAFAPLIARTIALAAGVIGRALVQSGIFGSVKLSVYALIYCAMAGLASPPPPGGTCAPVSWTVWCRAVLSTRSHGADNTASALILLVLAYGGYKMVLFSREIEDTDLTLSIMLWPIQITIPAGFALCAIRHFIYVLYPDEEPTEGSFAD